MKGFQWLTTHPTTPPLMCLVWLISTASLSLLKCSLSVQEVLPSRGNAVLKKQAGLCRDKATLTLLLLHPLVWKVWVLERWVKWLLPYGFGYQLLAPMNGYSWMILMQLRLPLWLSFHLPRQASYGVPYVQSSLRQIQPLSHLKDSGIILRDLALLL